MLAKKQTTVPVTMRALIQRINRTLKVDNEVLKAARSERVAASVGRYFIVRRNAIVSQRVNLEVLARELGALNEWEHVEI